MKIIPKPVRFAGMLGALLLLTSCASGLYHLDSSCRRKLAGLEEKSVVAGRFTISYLEGGTGEPVLLLHGFGADKDNWIRFARYLKGSCRVIAPDLPGFGESTVLPEAAYDIPSQVRRIHAFKHVLGVKKLHIAGNSMGGLIAGVYAATYPDEVLSLGLLDPGGIVDREPSGLTRELAKGNNPLIVEEASDFASLIDFMFVDPPFIPGMVKRYLGKRAAGRKAFLEKVFVEARPADQLERRMGDIKARTLVIWGEKDQVFPVSSAAVLGRGIADSRVIVLEACGHLPMIERPAETARHYLEWVGAEGWQSAF